MFIDIETIPVVKELASLDLRGQILFMKRFQREYDLHATTWQDMWDKYAALHAEFARVICVSLGAKTQPRIEEGKEVTSGEFRIKSFAERAEHEMLLPVCEVLLSQTHLIGHNIKQFDIPFLLRRLIINNIPIPPVLQVLGKKPWDIPHDDILEMWACGDFGAKISLDRMAYALGIDSPKEDISGADVSAVWYDTALNPEEQPELEKQALGRIKKYCEGDVITTANCYYRIKGLPTVLPEQIVYVE